MGREEGGGRNKSGNTCKPQAYWISVCWTPAEVFWEPGLAVNKQPYAAPLTSQSSPVEISSTLKREHICLKKCVFE